MRFLSTNSELGWLSRDGGWTNGMSVLPSRDQPLLLIRTETMTDHWHWLVPHTPALAALDLGCLGQGWIVQTGITIEIWKIPKQIRLQTLEKNTFRSVWGKKKGKDVRNCICPVLVVWCRWYSRREWWVAASGGSILYGQCSCCSACTSPVVVSTVTHQWHLISASSISCPPCPPSRASWSSSSWLIEKTRSTKPSWPSRRRDTMVSWWIYRDIGVTKVETRDRGWGYGTVMIRWGKLFWLSTNNYNTFTTIQQWSAHCQ